MKVGKFRGGITMTTRGNLISWAQALVKHTPGEVD